MQEGQEALQVQLLDVLQQALAAVSGPTEQQPVWEQAFQAVDDLQLPSALDQLLAQLQAAAMAGTATSQVRCACALPCSARLAGAVPSQVRLCLCSARPAGKQV